MPIKDDIIIKDTHRGLLYENGVLIKVLEAGRYTITMKKKTFWDKFFYPNLPVQQIILVDIRERDLTIKGQEILTADKVAIRVSIIVQYKVIDPRSALHAVENYSDRLYSDIQLAARRSLASMTLEEILTNRNRLNEDIMQDVKESAAGYGVAILRANIKDIVFPGNLQDVMNRVLTAERLSQAQLVEARTKAEVRQIEVEAQAKTQILEAQAKGEAQHQAALAAADLQKIKTEADLASLRQRSQEAAAFSQHPALLRLLELETLRDLATSSNARLYINFNQPESDTSRDD